MNTVQAIKNGQVLKDIMGVYPVGSKNHLLLAYGFNTGLRISDILQANVADSLKGIWKNREKKTGKEKEVKLNSKLQLLIRNYVEAEGLFPEDYLFYSNKNKAEPITRTQAHRIIAHAGDMVGVNLAAHAMRKTFGYMAYSQGVDISLLMELFNHSSQAITLRYIGITQETIDEVYEETIVGL